MWAVFAVSLALSTMTGTVHATEPGVGASIDYSERMMFYETPKGSAFENYDSVGGSLMLDLQHLRVSAGLASHFGAQIRHVASRELEDEGYHISYLNVTALGKLPLRLGHRFEWWPALGLRAAFNTRYAYTGTQNRTIDAAPHDLLVMAGAGLDFALTDRMALTATALGGWNMTPSSGDEARERKAFDVEFNLGILFRPWQ